MNKILKIIQQQCKFPQKNRGVYTLSIYTLQTSSAQLWRNHLINLFFILFSENQNCILNFSWNIFSFYSCRNTSTFFCLWNIVNINLNYTDIFVQDLIVYVTNICPAYNMFNSESVIWCPKSSLWSSKVSVGAVAQCNVCPAPDFLPPALLLVGRTRPLPALWPRGQPEAAL